MQQGGVIRRAQEAAQQRAGMEMLTAQRGELQAQLEQMAKRRNQLDEQRHVAPSPAARRELESRMSEIDARSARLDQQIASLNDRIVQEMGRVGGGAGGGRGVGFGGGQPVIVDVPRINIPSIQIPPDLGRARSRDFERMMVGGLVIEAVAFALLGIVAWRFGMRRMRDSFERAFSSQVTQLNQLQQAVDTVAIEVERISEGQRYVAKMLSEGAPAGVALPGRKASDPVPSSRNG